jgi:hypothetical protein
MHYVSVSAEKATAQVRKLLHCIECRYYVVAVLEAHIEVRK